MAPYIYLYLYALLMLILSFKPFLLRKNIFFIFTFIFILLISGLRYQIGVDYISYDNLFTSIREGTDLLNIEPIPYIFINIVNLFGLDNQFIFFIYSIATFVGIFYFILKLSPHKELSIFLFITIGIFYFSTFNGVRQWLAISFIMIAIVKKLENKNIQGSFFLLLAFLSHISALMFIIIYPFLFIRLKLKTIIYIITVLLLGTPVILFLISLTKYGIYLDFLKFSQKMNIFLFGIYSMTIFLIPLYFNYFKKKIILSNKMILLLNMNIISFLIIIIAFVMNIDFLIIMRVNMYFQMQLIILIPIFLYSIKNIRVRFLLFLLGIVFISFNYFYLLLLKGELYALTPYRFIF